MCADSYLHRTALRLFVIAAGFGLCVNVLVLAGPMFSLQVFDRVLTSRSLETLAMLLGLSLLMLAALTYLESVRMRLLEHATARLEVSALGPLLRLALERDAAHCAPDPHCVRDLRLLRQFLSSSAFVALIDIPFCPVLIVIMYLMHPSFGVAAAGGVALLMFLAIVSNQVVRRSSQAVAAASRTAAQCATDAVRNRDAVRAMGMLGIVQRRAVIASETASALWLSARRYPEGLATISKFVRQFMQLLVLALAACLVINNETSPGVMVASTLLLSRAMAPIDLAIAQWHTITEARSAYARLVGSAVETMPSQAMPSQAMPLTGAPTGALSVDAVSLSMGSGPTILKQVAFRLSAGEFLGIVGPTGAGKSMMARLLVGALLPTDGQVRLDGADLQAWPADQLGGHIGYLPQDVQLFDGTVAENIARLGDPVQEHEDVIAAARKAGIHELVLGMPYGYDTPIGSDGYALSGGMRQQVGLARAFFRDPKLVVLDEPNANLDAHGELALISAIEAVSMAGATLVVITHRPSLLRRANKVLVLQRGRVIEYGTREQVLSKFERAGRQPGALAPVPAGEASLT